MNRRLFLLALLSALLIAGVWLSRLAATHPYNPATLLGEPLWTYKASIPAGIFAAASIVAYLGLAAQLIRSQFDILRGLNTLPELALWCAWPFMLLSLISSHALFPWHPAEGTSSLVMMNICFLIPFFFSCIRKLRKGIITSIILFVSMAMTTLSFSHKNASIPAFLNVAFMGLACLTAYYFALYGKKKVRIAACIGLLVIIVCYPLLIFIPISDFQQVWPLGLSAYVSYGISLMVILSLCWLRKRY